MKSQPLLIIASPTYDYVDHESCLDDDPVTDRFIFAGLIHDRTVRLGPKHQLAEQVAGLIFHLNVAPISARVSRCLGDIDPTEYTLQITLGDEVVTLEPGDLVHSHDIAQEIDRLSMAFQPSTEA